MSILFYIFLQFVYGEVMNYNSEKWKRKREHILKLDGYKDRIEARYGRTIEAQIVHHIYPSAEYPQWAWCDWNLISVSKATHNRLEDRNRGRLTKLGQELQDRTEPGVDWRRKNKNIPPSF